MMKKPRIVVSGINMTSGGILSILLDCLTFLRSLKEQYEIIVLVHEKALVKEFINDFQFIEYPLAKKSWFIRCFYEYVYFYFLSIRLQPDLWISMHDISPNVKAKRRAVYCHNASQFYRLRKDEIFLDKKFTLFTWFYRYLYQINIRKNTYVIVQQQWLRDAFQKVYGIHNVIVAHPHIKKRLLSSDILEKHTLLYPTFPRVFKNVELIGEALKCMDRDKVRVLVTMDGSENAYAKRIYKQYGHLNSLIFIGLKERTEIFSCYEKVDALLFPSKLETWGLPLSEFALTKKSIFAADLPYAHESLSGYEKVKFFNPEDAKALAALLQRFSQGEKIEYDFVNVAVKEPYAKDWESLFAILLK